MGLFGGLVILEQETLEAFFRYKWSVAASTMLTQLPRHLLPLAFFLQFFNITHFNALFIRDRWYVYRWYSCFQPRRLVFVRSLVSGAKISSFSACILKLQSKFSDNWDKSQHNQLSTYTEEKKNTWAFTPNCYCFIIHAFEVLRILLITFQYCNRTKKVKKYPFPFERVYAKAISCIQYGF